jgi:hypothetical protein
MSHRLIAWLACERSKQPSAAEAGVHADSKRVRSCLLVRHFDSSGGNHLNPLGLCRCSETRIANVLIPAPVPSDCNGGDPNGHINPSSGSRVRHRSCNSNVPVLFYFMPRRISLNRRSRLHHHLSARVPGGHIIFFETFPGGPEACATVLRPALDQMANAAGFTSSRMFDKVGGYTPLRR